jgi:hypothetical protein
MAIDLGSVSFDEHLLVKQLQNDLRDDWFPDPLKFADMLAGETIAKYLVSNFEVNQGEYLPAKRTLFNVPKPNFTLRYGLETGLADRALYHGLTTFLIPFFDPLIPWNVFSHRYNTIHPDEKYTFRPSVPAWQDFIGAAKSALTAESWLLSTDVANCFEHIDLSVLRRKLNCLLPSIQGSAAQKSAIRAHIDLLFSCLRSWCYGMDRGLPQNRDASSFLANIYFHSVDTAMTDQGFGTGYFRYMDDVKVVCESEFAARRALKCLSLALRDIGLYLNSKKTVITPATDCRKVAECFDEGSPDLHQLDELWKNRSSTSITRAVPRLRELTLKLISEGNTDTRDFRFCIHRLTNLALSSDFRVPPSFFEEITSAIVGCVERYPASTDKVAQYLSAIDAKPNDMDRVADFLCKSDRCLYGWQNYWLWTMMASKMYISLDLASRAESLIRLGDDTPSRAGATLYLGAVGSEAAREVIARNFVSVKSFLGQRNALISLQEVPYRPLIEDHVRPNVRVDLNGIYRSLRKGKIAYFSSPQRIPLLQFPDLEIES